MNHIIITYSEKHQIVINFLDAAEKVREIIYMRSDFIDPTLAIQILNWIRDGILPYDEILNVDEQQ